MQPIRAKKCSWQKKDVGIICSSFNHPSFVFFFIYFLFFFIYIYTTQNKCRANQCQTIGASFKDFESLGKFFNILQTKTRPR